MPDSQTYQQHLAATSGGANSPYAQKTDTPYLKHLAAVNDAARARQKAGRP
jgi:hypothetical protein